MIKHLYILLFALIISILITSCPKIATDPSAPDMSVNEFIYYTMKDYYLWHEKVPTVNYSSYQTPEELLDALVYSTPTDPSSDEYDRWSYVTDATEQSDLEEGEMHGYGFILRGANNKTELRVAFVENNSPANTAGLKRGQKILKINNHVVTDLESTDFLDEIEALQSAASTDFYVQEPDETGDTNTKITIVQGTITLDAVSTNKTITSPDTNKKVGYLLFSDFIDPDATADLNQAFSQFKSQGIDELVLDLRYNGGGRIDIAAYLASLVNGTATSNKVFTKLVYNNRRENNFNAYLFEDLTAALNLQRIYVISTGSTASASESVINGLKPFIDVILIGTKTHGKPVGMLVLKYKNIALVPIMFKGVNAQNEGNFFSGIQVDKTINEDYTYALGDPEELCLKEALFHIDNNQFSTSRAYSEPNVTIIPKKGIKKEMGRF